MDDSVLEKLCDEHSGMFMTLIVLCLPIMLVNLYIDCKLSFEYEKDCSHHVRTS